MGRVPSLPSAARTESPTASAASRCRLPVTKTTALQRDIIARNAACASGDTNMSEGPHRKQTHDGAHQS